MLSFSQRDVLDEIWDLGINKAEKLGLLLPNGLEACESNFQGAAEARHMYCFSGVVVVVVVGGGGGGVNFLNLGHFLGNYKG